MFRSARNENARMYATDVGALNDIQTIAADMDIRGIAPPGRDFPSFQKIFREESSKKPLSWFVKYELDQLMRTRGRVGALIDTLLLLPESWNSVLKEEIRLLTAPVVYIDELARQLYLRENPKRFVNDKKGKQLMIALRDSVSSRAVYAQQELQKEVQERARGGDVFAIGLKKLLQTPRVFDLFSSYEQKSTDQDFPAAWKRCEELYPRLCKEYGPIRGSGSMEELKEVLRTPMSAILLASILECVYPQD